MTRRAFTMVEMLLAVMLVGVITVLSVLTFRAVTKSWLVSTSSTAITHWGGLLASADDGWMTNRVCFAPM